MRKSVERRKLLASERRRVHQASHRRIVFILILIALCMLTVSGMAYYDYAERVAETKRTADQQALFAQIDKQVAATKQKKLDDAKKAEAAAKASAAANEAAQKAKNAANPSGPTANKVCDVTNPASITVILNKIHCFKPIDWAPSDLTSIGGYLMRQEAATHMIEMMNAASHDGAGFELSSAYRSYANQQATYETWVVTNGSQAAADTVSARAGFSEHQTGLAADLKVSGCALECFGSTTQYAWLADHAADYGFIRRYPIGLTSITGYSPEAWHWRYVGIATAHDMKIKGIETMEQYFGVSGGDYI